MKKIFYLLILVSLFFSNGILLADTTSSSNDPAYNQARQNYRAYLEQLKTLRNQYRQVTDEVKKIVAEEGMPVWDENADSLKVSDLQTAPVTSGFGDVDIKETDKEFIVKTDLPGLEKDKIQVKIEDSQFLKISGTREFDKEVQGNNQGVVYTRRERQNGSFEKTVKLPSLVQDHGNQARYENGVLTVTVPKAKEAKKEVVVPVQ